MLAKKNKIATFRQCFFGRQDVYGRAWESVDKDGKQVKGYAPVCANFWSDVCHIKLRDGKPCATCAYKHYEAVSDDSIWKHISGAEKHNFYVLQTDRTTKLGVIDFDCKPGKEAKGYKWEDVKVTSDFLKSEGIHHCVARSTTMGHHLYIFFEDFVRGAKVKEALFFTFEKLGFFEQFRQGIRPIPEAFPKQANAGFGIGNGITPGMIEPMFAKERNGLVDEQGNFIPADQQWAALAATPRCSAAALDAFLSKYGVEVEDTEEATSDGPGTGYRKDLARTYHNKKGGWQHPLTGSIEKVVEGCAAMRAVVTKCRSGEVLGHHEGFSLWHLALHTVDGIEWFKKNVPGWGESERDLRQLDHSIEKNYLPPSCTKLQESGVCPMGKKCFDPKPPLILMEGKYVVDKGAPPHAPSPIRYAFGAGDDFLEKLKAEVDDLTNEKDENLKGNRIRELAKRGQVFDDDQQRVLREYILSKKLLKAPDIKKIFNKADSAHVSELKEKADFREDSVRCGDNVYRLTSDPPGFGMMKRVKDGVTFTRFSECTVIIEEERRYLDEDVVIKSVYCGKFTSVRGSIDFEIDVVLWAENKELVKYFSVLACAAFNVLREDLDYFRQAALAFSDKMGIKRTNNLVTQGWYQGTFLMPSVMIDKDGVKENKDKIIDLSSKHHAAGLDFKILGQDELKDVMAHIYQDFLNAWPRKWTTICLSHAFLPAILSPLGIRKKPSLFLEGLTGSGKTEVLHHAQYFWGDFESLVNLASTGKGLMSVAHDFKDCLVVFDDYKGIDYAQLKALQTVVQYSYDPNKDVKLNRNSSLMKPKAARGLIAFTGEHFIENDAAMVARTILLEVDKQDTKTTRDKYVRCKEMREMYCGIMPHFIHWFLGLDIKEVREKFRMLQTALQDSKNGAQNIDRISHNLALNHLVWGMFLEFSEGLGVIDGTTANNLLAEHRGHIQSVMWQMLSRCQDEQNGEVFKRILVQLICSREVIIEGFNDNTDDRANKPVIGFTTTSEKGQAVVNILPEQAFKIVKSATRDSPIRGTEREFGRQFAEAKMFADTEGNRNKNQVRWRGARVYVWPFIMEELGINDGKLRAVDGYKNQKVAPEDLPQVVDGLF